MNKWVGKVIDLIQSGAVNEAIGVIAASSSEADLADLEQTLQDLNFAGRLEVAGPMSAIRARIAALFAAKTTAASAGEKP